MSFCIIFRNKKICYIRYKLLKVFIIWNLYQMYIYDYYKIIIENFILKHAHAYFRRNDNWHFINLEISWYYGRGLGSQCYLTCLHASCNVATFNVWLFNAWYSCFNSNLTLLHSISSFCNLASVHLTFVLRPCRIFIVQCVMPFFVLPLFILRPAIILTSSCHHCFVCANLNYTSRWRFTRTNKLGGH